MKKQFKAESKKLLDLMINSIYTNRDIFLRELISNASDAIDKLYYQSLTDSSIKINKNDFEIRIEVDKVNRKLIISDNGIGMDSNELEENLGTIAKSDSLIFKEENKDQTDVDIIGQFGVGFYSAFMISEKIEVLSRKYGSNEAYLWTSTGQDGYTVNKSEKDTNGTTITLYLKEDTEDIKYSDYLEEYKIRTLIKKYSDYIRYPINMKIENSVLKEGTDEYETILEDQTLNSMLPLWKRNKKDITEEEYSNFYTDKFFDYEKPFKVIHYEVEGQCSYKAILFIPSHMPYDLYSKDYEKGLQLYSNDVLIMDKCDKLLPDYLNFVKGVVDSPDLSLNISRETLQEDRKLQVIAKSIEHKVLKELDLMLKNERDEYKKFFKNFGIQLKFGVYNNYGMDKDKLKDLLLFHSASNKDLITLEEYINNMKKKQEDIFYACGETIDKIDLLPQVESVKDKKYDILYLTEPVDEFALKMLVSYNDKKFINVSSKELDLYSKEEKKEIEELNEKNKDMFEEMTKSINNIKGVRFTKKLKNHPVCLTTEGELSIEMEKALNAMPNGGSINADVIMEINASHPIVKKLEKLYKNNKEEFLKYTKILYSQARLIEGLTIDNPTEFSNLVCDLIAK